MDPTISYRSQSRAMLQAPSLKAASQGLDVRKSVPPCGGREVFFLDILFYRTSPHPRRRRDIDTTPCATLTIHLVQKSGQSICASFTLSFVSFEMDSIS